MRSTPLALTAVTALMLTLSACRGSADAPPASSSQATPQAAPPSSPASAGSAEPVDPDSVPIDVTASVDGTSYQIKGRGQCTFTSDASIYDVPAAQWRATLKTDGQAVGYVNVTVWQFKESRSNETTVGLQIGPDFRHLATVTGATLVGSATANAEHSGKGAVLTVDGRDARGKSLAVKVTCAAVTAAVEEGGR